MKKTFWSKVDIVSLLKIIKDPVCKDCLINIIRSKTQRKHITKWIDSIQNKNYLLAKRQPWLVFDAIDFLNKLNLKDKLVFEYGSGSSTLYWIDKLAYVVSIEHDSVWHGTISNLLRNNDMADYRLIEPEIFSSEQVFELDPSDPDKYVSSDYDDKIFKRYVCQIDTFSDQSFDIILIDGRARPSCIKHSTSKIKVGGFIIVDNSERDYYFIKTNKFLTNFKRLSFTGIAPCAFSYSRTDIFQRISPI
jgi:hypothetical protein